MLTLSREPMTPEKQGTVRAVCAERRKHGSREGGTGDPARDDRPLLYSFIGSHASNAVAERPVRLQVGWEKAGEGTPDEPAQARMQMSIHVKVVGLLLDQRGHDSDSMLSRS